MLSVAQALDGILALMAPVGTETVPLAQAGGRVLAADAVAGRDQPPFAASSMDGYAVRAADCRPGARFRVTGEVPAGRSFAGRVGPGEAVRLFTGAPLPEGTDAVLIQEDTRPAAEGIEATEAVRPGENVRPRGSDFTAGTRLAAPRRISSAEVALLAAMNVAAVTVRRRPVVAIIPTGDELVEPGETPRADQIVASTHLGLSALLALHGADPRPQPIARDSLGALRASFDSALALAPDLIVTLGGASVGDYDLVRDVVGAGALSFYKVAMRPGKPLMAGLIGGVPLVGLPGNPVSAMVCGHVFLRPALDAMLGLPAAPLARARAPLAVPLGAGGPREHYMRARLDGGAITPFATQDSGAILGLATADALLVQPPHGPALPAGAEAEYIPLHGDG
jgi:molybdopterin molybdotransferase